MSQPLWIGLLCASLLFANAAFAVKRIEAQALMSEAALLRIDGQQRMLRNGQRSPEGVLLVGADPRRAIIEVDGVRQELTLSRVISANFAADPQAEVRVERSAAREYLTTGEINGQRVLMKVDTGATIVALSGAQATALGINYRRLGTPSQVSTAGGIKSSYSLQLDRVAIGAITVNYVPAVVVEGDFPEVALLGMSYLQHVGIREENGVLFLRQKY